MIPMHALNRCLISGHPLEVQPRPSLDASPRTESPREAPPEVAPAVTEVWEYLTGKTDWQDSPEDHSLA